MKKIVTKISCVVMMLLILVGCATPQKSTTQQTNKIKVGVLQFVKHEALDDALKGFQETMNKEFGDRIVWDIQVANGDISNLQSISEKLARDNDILYAIATPAAQALATVETKKPIFIAAVTDPVAAGLADSLEKPGKNVTGTSDMAPINEQVSLLVKTFPNAKNIGIIYNSSEVNSQVLANLATKELTSKHLNVEKATVTSSNDVSQVLQALIKKIDVMFLITDNTIDSSIALVGDMLKEAKIPTVGSSESIVKKNGLMTLSNAYEDFGKQTAQMAIRHIKEGVAVSEMKIETAQKLNLIVNEDFAKAIDLDVSQLKE